MHLFVINLPEHVERWRATEAAFAQVGLCAERFDALRGAAMPPDTLARHYSAKANEKSFYRPLTLAEIGCYASHLAVWQHMVDQGWPLLAVFEDDVCPDDGLPNVLRALQRGPRNWDMVKLIGRELERPYRPAPLTERHQLIGYRRVPSLTGGYVISRDGAHKLLNARMPFGRPIDVDLRHWWECGLRIRGVWPYPLQSSEDSAASTIGARALPDGLATRWRKLKYQGLYTWNTWRHRAVP